MTDTAKHATTPPPPAACARADPAASGGTRCSVAAVTADESVRREVARRQAAALGAVSPAPSGGRTPSRWAHVPLAALFEDASMTHNLKLEPIPEVPQQPWWKRFFGLA